MSGPYFPRASWPDFIYQGETFGLTHLAEGQIEVEDSKKLVRRIAISYSDHCFTREPKDGDDAALRYPHSTRNPGYFCVERYQLSLSLPAHLAQAMKRKVWNLQGENYAVVPIVDHQGTAMLYGIVFSLDRVKKLPVDLDMRVRTGFPCDITDIATYGEVRFGHLVTLRMQGKTPNRNFDRHRPRPRLAWKPGQK